jgi:hypothetical protein
VKVLRYWKSVKMADNKDFNMVPCQEFDSDHPYFEEIAAYVRASKLSYTITDRVDTVLEFV